MSKATTRPILFSAALIPAILAGGKTQTRRVVKPQPATTKPGPYPGPYGVPGDRLWVRETWRIMPTNDFNADFYVQYKADSNKRLWRDGENLYDYLYVHSDGTPKRAYATRWRSSIHLPREFSRITLEIVSVRVERLQDISDDDAMAEGADEWIHIADGRMHGRNPRKYQLDADTWRKAYRLLWDSINGKKPGNDWNSNPFVWVVEFKRIPQETP